MTIGLYPESQTCLLRGYWPSGEPKDDEIRIGISDLLNKLLEMRGT